MAALEGGPLAEVELDNLHDCNERQGLIHDGAQQATDYDGGEGVSAAGWNDKSQKILIIALVAALVLVVLHSQLGTTHGAAAATDSILDTNIGSISTPAPPKSATKSTIRPTAPSNAQKPIEPIGSAPSDPEEPMEASYKIDSSVYEDDFIANFPDKQTKAVQNALFLARKLKKLLKIDGFEVKRNGKHLGFLPVMYAGFPKHGTSSAWHLVEESVPCLIQRRKETHFWFDTFLPKCKHKKGLITSCDDDSIVERFTLWMNGGDYVNMHAKSNEKQMLKKGTCDPPIFLDFSPKTMFQKTIRIPDAGNTDDSTQVPCEQLVIIHELTPKALFLAIARDWDVALLRTSWWFFNSRGTGTEYFEALQQEQKQLDKVLAYDSVCQGLFEVPFYDRSVNAWAGSCNLGAVAKLFGEDQLFITTAGPLMRCETDFNRWMASAVGTELGIPKKEWPKYGLNCNAPSHSKFNAHNTAREEKAITVEMTKLEDKLIETFKAECRPLLVEYHPKHQGGGQP